MGSHQPNFRRIRMWPNDRFIKLAGIHLPIIQAPMAGSALSDIVVAVSELIILTVQRDTRQKRARTGSGLI